MPVILSVLGDFIKSTQPGVEVAEAKVRFWAICEKLVFSAGEVLVSTTPSSLVHLHVK